MNELGGVFTDDADAEELLIGASKDELEHTGCVTGNVATRVVRVKGAADNVVQFLFPAGFFGLAGCGYFRNRINTHREQRGDSLLVLQAKRVTDGNAALLHGSGGQRGESDDVSCSVNMRDRGSVVFVN